MGGLTALSKVRTGKLTVIDSSKGNGAVGVAVRNGGTLVFDPENDNTTLLQLDVYGGTVQLYGGKISRDGLRFENSVTLADLLPEEGGFAYYREGGAKLTIEQATSASCNLVVKSCDHNGTNGFDINSFTCPDCGAPAVAQTALKNVEGNPWRNFTNLQTALNSDRDGSSTLRLLADVSGDYTINGSVYTGLDLNGYSIKGTVSVTGNGGKETAFSNSGKAGTVQKVVASVNANLAVSGAAAIIDTLQLAEGATWENILYLPRNPGYKVYTDYPDLTKYTWYAPEDVSDTLTELTNVTIERLPITSTNLYFKVNGKNVTSVDRGTTVQLCAYCNQSGASVMFYVKEPGDDGYTRHSSVYQKIGSTSYYVAEYPFNTVSDLFGDDQLTGTIKLTYVDNDGNEIVPSTSNSGEFIIRASGLTAPNENYAVVFVDGTLTVSRRPSSGGSSHGDYVIKASAGTGGSISPSGNVSVRKGADQTFTIKPDKGYAVADVKVDGKSVGAVRSYTFKNIAQSHTIEVSFVKAIGAPDTGDGSNLPLWFALLFASACGLAGTTLYKRRKRVK